MQYLKQENNIIQKYPYGFEDLKRDNPKTGFNSDVMNGDYDATLVNYNVYLVQVATKPTITSSQYLTQKSQPELINSQWTLGWNINNYTQEELRRLKFDPINFQKQLKLNDKFKTWSNIVTQISTVSYMFLFRAFDVYVATNDNMELQDIYDSLKATIPIPLGADSEWQVIADNNGIEMIF